MDTTTPLTGEDHVVIIGGGLASVELADALRQQGYPGRLTLVCAETHAPYQRPPLSKDLKLTDAVLEVLPLRGPGFFEANDVDARFGVTAEHIDRAARRVRLSDGSDLDYTHMVLATGARNRSLPVVGAELIGVQALRTFDDAAVLQTALSHAENVVIVGAGFIGLEVAACANGLGKNVTVLEFAERPMGRALSPLSSGHIAETHRTAGIDLRLGEGIERIEGEAGSVAVALGSSGTRYPADTVLIGVGVAPNTELAEAAGLAVDNGILVDARLRTEDPRIWAIGDCANYPNAHSRSMTRLESVQNATDQARYLATALTAASAEDPGDYCSLPWFWSNQGPVRIQIAGLIIPGDETVLHGDPASGKFSVLAFRDGVLAAVESINSPRDHRAARALLSAPVPPTREQLADPELDLRAFAAVK
ncbi:NAD(P)/FAD-dependent oxidoreductase [Nesterenkonia populi]|uniref:NAD(P)/FAD-dependent oxidoreductase n=1 Tax=Nesterenkonia populi TaxID=1591087 RepID=UPI001B885E76|nr:FAD-dependent oxidoreductase [Nesterenkonia populi]